MKYFFAVILILLSFFSGWFLKDFLNVYQSQTFNEIKNVAKEIKRPLDFYTIENLKNFNFVSSNIVIENEFEEKESYSTFVFKHTFNPGGDKNSGKTVTGLINIPGGEGKFPIIIMIRGFVSQEIYKPGMGSSAAAAFFADNNFITIAPDFFGYGGSSKESGNVFESRFQTYTTVLSILSSLKYVDKWDGKNIFIWAHSNGGQIALTTLVITGKDIPTVLWAPVTKPFPYSVLYYTDEAEDKGKFLRKKLAEFENIYDSDKYSFTNYLDNIHAPIFLDQGTGDDAVPVTWSRNFVNILKSKKIDALVNIYPGADHNMKPSWNDAILKDLEFFKSKLVS